MRFKRVTFNLLSPLIGFHYGKNPVSGQRFLHVAPLPFIGLDFEFPPYVNPALIIHLDGQDYKEEQHDRT